MWTIDYSSEFLNSLDEIIDYLSFSLFSPLTAVKFSNELIKFIEKLHQVPDLGTPLSAFIEDLNPRFSDHFRLLYKKYAVIYYSDEKLQIITVDFVFHGSQNYTTLFTN